MQPDETRNAATGLVEAADEIFAALKAGELSVDEAYDAWIKSGARVRQRLWAAVQRLVDAPARRIKEASGMAVDRNAADVRPLSSAVWLALAIERHRQDEKWGGRPGIDRRDDHTYAAVLGEEFGEVCKAWLERDVEGLRVELIQTAAVALAWIEELDNGGMVPRAAA